MKLKKADMGDEGGLMIKASKQEKAFEEFYNSARYNEILDSKTTLMIHLTAAMAVACYPCMEHYLDQVKAEGITDEQIGVIKSIVMAVSSGRVDAQLWEVRDKMRKEHAKAKKTKAGVKK
jgi:alkylhydroperoxidase/carboxymuconolactone decarboxylase family protein YurZ